MKILSHATYIGTSGFNSYCQNFFKALNKTHVVKIRNFSINSKNWKGLQSTNPHGVDADELDRDLIVQQGLWKDEKNDILKDFDIYAGLKDYTPDVNIVLAEVNHQYYFHNYSGPKIAYTIWESTTYPENFFNKLKEYDQVWVPSKFQAEITAKQGIESNKIKIIPGGVNSSLFYPEDLKYEDDKFRFLIFGRWDDRKSIRELIEAFKNVFGESEKVELVISVDNPQSVDGMKSTEERLKFYKINSDNIKILHFPSKEEYAKYLKRGHVFLSCARSEGWNLPLIEAMACGIPSLYSNCSGQLEFAQGKGIPVDVKGTSTSLYVNCYSENQSIGDWYTPDFKDLESKILEVYNNYNFYKAAALKDSVLIRNEFTWDNAAKKADQAIKELFKKRPFKILFITPHLSTGGGPQYLLKKIIELKDDHDVYCVEYTDVCGGVLVVQKDQIQSLLKEKLITLREDKFELIKHIRTINPDVIHFEELPEYFCDKFLAQQIYSSGRTYKIIETSHDSSFNPNNKCFFPDGFALISEYQRRTFACLNIPMSIVEYPIVYRKKSDRDTSLKDLNLDPRKTHFLNVGLFTSRKNQSEIIEYAKYLLNKNVQFHFVGNQAENFKYYWEPLMKQFPSNCKWWGERKDVDTFYNAMDVFLFTSRGTVNDKETSPLVIREAIGWDLPLLMYNLPVYCGMYDKYKNVTWLENDVVKNLDKIKSFIINEEPIPKELFDISFNEESNRLDVNYNGENTLTDVLFTVKDCDSRTCIYSIRWQFLNPNSTIWVMPLPKHVCDFKNDINFRGFLLQIFSKNKTEKVYEKEIILKNIQVKKPVLEFSDEDPIFNNYNEFFIDKIYDELNLKNLNICFDIGSNVGLFTKYLKLNNCNKILCFEPNKMAFNSLQKNLKDERDLKLFNLAVSHNNESLRLYIDDNNSLISSAHDVRNNYYDVETITLKDIFEKTNIQKVDFVKIDIEGMEFDLIENLEDSIFQKIDKFLIEYHDFYFTDGSQKLEKLKNKLSLMGYEIVNKHRFIYATKFNQ